MQSEEHGIDVCWLTVSAVMFTFPQHLQLSGAAELVKNHKQQKASVDITLRPWCAICC